MGDRARMILGVVRLLNGIGSLFVPGQMARRFGIDPASNPAALYVLRLFGVRTIVLGAELLWGDDRRRRDSLEMAPMIHASDTVAAVIAGARGYVPRRAATMATVISAANTGMAILARRSAR
jgi:uncharacterized protein YjeT (DUF2065 family)